MASTDSPLHERPRLVSSASDGARLALHLAIIGLAAWHVAITVTQYFSGHFYTHDVGHIDYMFFYSWHGRFMWSIVCECCHFGKHFTPTLLLLLPLYKITSHVLLIPILEVLAIMSGGWAVAWMFDGLALRGRSVRRMRGLSPTGLALGLLYVANPYVGAIMLANHFESFATALTLWTLAALVNRRLGLFWLFLILTLGVKEDMALYWGWFGVWWIVFGRLTRPRLRGLFTVRQLLFGLAVVAFCAIWLAVALITIRHVAESYGQAGVAYAHRYQWLGDTLADKLRTFYQDAFWVVIPGHIGALLVPTALFVPLIAPETLILGLPGAYLMGLSAVVPMRDLLYYYSYPLIPFLFFGASLGVVRVFIWSELRRRRHLVRTCVLIVIIAGGAWFVVRPTHTDDRRRTLFQVTERDVWVRDQLRRQLPSDATVAAQYDLLCQIPKRVGMLPLSTANIHRAEYWALDWKGEIGDLHPLEYREILDAADRLVESGDGEFTFNEDGLLIVHQYDPPLPTFPERDAEQDAEPDSEGPKVLVDSN